MLNQEFKNGNKNATKCHCCDLEMDTCDHTENHNHKLDALNSITSLILTLIYGLLHNTLIHNNQILDFSIILSVFIMASWKLVVNWLKEAKFNIFNENFLILIATIAGILIHDTFEALLLVSLFRMGELLQSITLSKAKETLREKIFDLYTNVRINHDGEEKLVSAFDIKVGMNLTIKPGERVLVDSEIVKGRSYISISEITGETTPISVSQGDKIFSGSIVIDGTIEVKALSRFEDSYIYKVIKLVESTKNNSKTEKFISKLSKYYTPIIVTISALTFVVPVVFGLGNLGDWLYKSLIFLVLACPCAIVISIPLTYSRATGEASNEGIIFKDTASLDNISRTKSIFFDKTGTLTKGESKISKFYLSKGISEEKLMFLANLASRGSNHPLSKALSSIPIKDSSINVSSYLELPGYGVIAYSSLGKIIIGSDKLLHKENISHDTCNTNSTVVHVALDENYLGYISFEDTFRENIKDLIDELRRLGVLKFFILTGDSKNSDQFIEDLKIDGYFNNLTPHDKVRIVEDYKSQKPDEITTFVGDGINDAMAMKKSDISISFGKNLSYITTSSSDIVIIGEDISKIIRVFTYSRKVKEIVITNSVLALSIKSLVMISAAFGMITLWLAVLSDVGAALLTILISMTKKFR